MCSKVKVTIQRGSPEFSAIIPDVAREPNGKATIKINDYTVKVQVLDYGPRYIKKLIRRRKASQ